jgi:hypothetical protein
MSQNRWSTAWVVLGIIASIAWAVSAWHHSQQSALESAQSFGALTYKTCTNQQLLAKNANLAQCERERDKSAEKWLKEGNYTANGLFIALVPIPFIWLTGIILLYVVRAQIAGFREVLPWGKLNIPKRIFLVLCACFTFAVIAFGVTVLLNMYVDSKVPVSLSPFVDVMPSGDLVTVAGTWVRTDLTDDSIANPIQTSKIECYKLQGKCIESTAYVNDTLLGTDLQTFDIKQWTTDVIVFTDEDLCATATYTIDLHTQVVSGAGYLTNQDSNLCKMNFKSKERWSLLLSNGFNVYWKFRQQARPWLLRIIQSLFGN